MRTTIDNKHELEFLLDTGAELTVIPPSYLKGESLPLTSDTQYAYGAGGERMCFQKTQPVVLSVGPAEVVTSLWIGQACQPLLGMDVLLQLNSSLEFSEGKIAWNLRRLQKEELTQHPIWAKDKNDCGILDMDPVKLTGTPPPCTRQYPINRTAIEGIKPIIADLESRGVVVKTSSSSNSPVWPVKKANGSWRLTIDYRQANKTIDKLTPLVANPSTIFNTLKPEHKWFTVIDMVNAYWTVRLSPESQNWLAFTVDGQQYKWTRLPQGLHNSGTFGCLFGTFKL